MTTSEKIEERLNWFRTRLKETKHTPRTQRRYLQVARHFILFLDKRSVTLETAAPPDVSAFIHHELILYRRQQGRPPRNVVDWRCGNARHSLLAAFGPGSVAAVELRLQGGNIC